MIKTLQPGLIKKGSYFLLLFFITTFSPFIALTQVRFSAVCTNKKISKNDYLQVQYVIENASNVEQVIPPSFKNFTIVSGPNQQSSMSNINGAIKQYVAIGFILKPDRPGNYILAPATAKVNGKSFLSNSLSVQVTNATGLKSGGTSISPFGNMITEVPSSPPAHQFDDYILHEGEDLKEKIKKNLFVKLDVSKTSCYVGEPIVATYKLYTRLKSESSLIKTPSFNGFSVSEMETPDSDLTTTEKYNGREYTVYNLRKVQLYPLQSGNIELEPVEVENNITFIKAAYANSKRGDIFYNMLRNFVDAATPSDAIEQQKITLESKPLTILIKALPTLNKPEDFKGAVGIFDVHAAVEKTSMTTDEAGNLTLTISGNGNMEMINAPKILWPAGVEAFEPKSSESIDKTTVPLRGEKKFSYSFTVSKHGTYIIPAVRFSYFDIATQNYKMLSTSSVSVTVKKGKGFSREIFGRLNKLSNNKEEGFRSKLLNWSLLISIGALFLVGLLALFMKKRVTKPALVIKPLKDPADNTIAVREPEQQVPDNPLLQAENMLITNNTNNFYYTLNNCLRRYLSVKLNFSEKELSKKKINELLDKHNVAPGTALMLSSLLENIEVNLYTPVSPANQMQEVYNKAGEIISLLDKQLS